MITKTHLPTGVHHFLCEGVVVCFFIKDRSGSAAIVALSQSRKIVAMCFAFALVVAWCVKCPFPSMAKVKSFVNGKCFVLRQKTKVKKTKIKIKKIKIRIKKIMTKIKGIKIKLKVKIFL